MMQFGVFSPVIQREDIPSILLPVAMSPDSKNVRLDNGEIVRYKMRTRAFVRTQHDCSPGWSAELCQLTISGDQTAEFKSGDALIIVVYPMASEPSYLSSYSCSGDSYTSGDDTIMELTPCVVPPPDDRYTDFVMKAEDLYTGDPTSGNFAQVQTPDDNPILHYATFTKKTGGVDVEYVFAFTQDNAYRWDSVLTRWDRVHVCSGEATHWSTTVINDRLVAVNNIDVPLMWGENVSWPFVPLGRTLETSTGTVTVTSASGTVVGSGTDFSGDLHVGDIFFITSVESNRVYLVDSVTSGTELELSAVFSGDTAADLSFAIVKNKGPATNLSGTTFIEQAKLVTSFENHLFFGDVTIASDRYPGSICWSDLGDETGFTFDGTGRAGIWNGTGEADTYILPGSDFVSAFGEIDGFLVLFKEGSVHLIWLADTDVVWNTKRISKIIGCKAPDSVVNDPDGKLYFFATDYSIRELESGRVSEPIKPTIDSVESSLVADIRSTYIEPLREIWWAMPLPIGASTITENTKVLCYNLKSKDWTEIEMPVSAFGKYTRQTEYTWDTLPFESWDEWAWDRWDIGSIDVGYPYNFAGDFSGLTNEVYARETDLGTAYEGYLVLSTDLSGKQSLDVYKRLLEATWFFRPGTSGDTVTISISRDGGAYEEYGTISLYNSAFPKYIAVETRDEDFDYRAKTFEIEISATNRFAFLGVIFGYEVHGTR